MRFSAGKWLAAGLLALTAVANAQISKSGNGYLFRMKYAKGQVINYLITSSGSMNAQNFAVTMSMAQKVTDVQSGVGTIQLTMGSPKMTLNGQPMSQQMPKMPTTTVKMDAMGHVVGGSTQQNMTSVGLPKNPVKIGDSWTASTKAPTGPGGAMDVKATYKFQGFERVGAMNTAKIAITLNAAGQTKVNGSGTLWLNAADGSMVKNTTKMNVSMGANSMPMTMTITRK